jgi:hypothetical protein
MSVQIGSGAHPPSYPVSMGALSQLGKAAGAWSWHPSPASAEVEKTWMYTSTTPYAFMA